MQGARAHGREARVRGREGAMARWRAGERARGISCGGGDGVAV